MKNTWFKRDQSSNRCFVFRQSKRISLSLLLIFAIFFLFYQFLFISLLNDSESKSLEANSKSSHISSLSPISDITNVFDQTGIVRGSRLMDLKKYKPDEDGMFTCFSSGVKIAFAFVNDNYCDCPEDGSDEPGTNACDNGYFYCRFQTRHRSGRGIVQVIPSSRVNDGICDCCDGTDEWAGNFMTNVLPLSVQKKLGTYQAPCRNTCPKI